MYERATRHNCHRRSLNSVPKAVALSEVWRSAGGASATPAPSFATIRHMAISDRQMLDSLSRMPFIDSVELAGILGELRSTVHGHLADDIVGK